MLSISVKLESEKFESTKHQLGAYFIFEIYKPQTPPQLFIELD